MHNKKVNNIWNLSGSSIVTKMAGSKYVLLLFGLLAGNLNFAQQTYFSIVGTITDAEKKPVEAGNVILLSPKDSSILKGDLFSSGKFKLVGLTKDHFLLKIVALGYQDHISAVTRTNSDSIMDVGNTELLAKNTLKEVEISGKIPFFESDGEKIRVNVENTGLNASGTALDVLRQSPGVLVSNTDNVSVFGKGQALIYLDGQLLASTDLLKSVPSSDIKNIEIINNPSAKYDAAGRAVINIITRKNTLQGYNGNLIQNFLYGKYLFSYSGLRFNYKNKKWSLNFGYGYVQGQVWSSDAYYRKFNSSNSSETEMNNAIFEKQRNSNVHNYRMGVAYAFDSVHVLGFQYNGYYSDISANIDNSNNITNNGISQFTIHTLTDAKPLLINNSFNLVYNQKLDTAGGELFGAVQYGDFSSSNSGLINQTITIGNTTNASEKRNTSLNDIQLFTAQLDYNKGLSKKWKLETGLKDSYIINTNNSKFENLAPSGEWISDPAYYSGFAYKENVLAGYANLLFRKKKFHFRSGVRAELTSSDGFSYSLNSQVIDRQYLDFFPSAFAGYDFTSDLTAGVAYSSRIIRPTYQDMEPTVNYIDSLSSFRGNPYLKPEYTNAGEVSLTYMKEASITFGYSQTQGALRLVVDKLNNNSDAFVATTKNIDKATAYTLGLTIPYELDWWTTSNNFGYSFNTYSYSSGGQLIQNSKPLLYVYLYNEFSAKKLFSCEIIYDYNSGGVDGIFVLKPYSKLTATIKKTFLKDKLTCRIMFNDIFNSYVMAGNSNVQGYTVNYVSKMNSHFILLGLNYKFGKVKTPEYNDQSINKGEFERIKTPK